MQDRQEIARLAARAGLDLSDERAELVANAFSELWPGLEALNGVDVGSIEPALVFRHDSAGGRDEHA